jgi:hypothetical protein
MAREAALEEKAGEATRTPDIFLGKELSPPSEKTDSLEEKCLGVLRGFARNEVLK